MHEVMWFYKVTQEFLFGPNEKYRGTHNKFGKKRSGGGKAYGARGGKKMQLPSRLRRQASAVSSISYKQTSGLLVMSLRSGLVSFDLAHSPTPT